MSKLTRIKPAYDRVVAEMPGWKCYCCRDTGFVARQEYALEGFCDGTPSEEAVAPSDLALLCKHCDIQYSLSNLSQHVDDRLTATQCKEIHQRCLEDWLTTVRTQADRRLPRAASHPSGERTASFAAIAEVLQG